MNQVSFKVKRKLYAQPPAGQPQRVYFPWESWFLLSGSRLPLSLLTRLHVKHHGRKGNAQLDGRLFTFQHTGVAMPALLRVADEREGLFFSFAEHIGRADIHANPAGNASPLLMIGEMTISHGQSSLSRAHLFSRQAVTTFSFSFRIVRNLSWSNGFVKGKSDLLC